MKAHGTGVRFSHHRARVQGLQVPESKWCPDCSALLPADSFCGCSTTRDGLLTYCSKCAYVRNLEHRRQRAASPPGALPAEKRCAGPCGRVLPLAAFAKDGGSADRHCRSCRVCTDARPPVRWASGQQRIVGCPPPPPPPSPPHLASPHPLS